MPPEELPAPLAEGFLPPRYTDVRPLGLGGMASVHVARDTQIGRSVVVKVLDEGRIGPTEREECRRRFVTEARAAAAIHHPNVITILDTGTGPDGRPYIVMEQMPRGSLRAFADDALADPATVAGWISQAAAGLAAAHRAGVVHRDVKPDNLLLDADGWLKVSDFGIARVRAADDGGSVTRTGMMMGTAGYMAPETYANAAAAGPASDAWALAATAYRLLTGRSAYGGGYPIGDVPPASGLRPGLPVAVDGVLARGLAAAPDDRPPATAFAAELAAAVEGATSPGETVPIPRAPAPAVPPTRITPPIDLAPPPSPERPTEVAVPPASPRPAPRRRAVVLAVAAAVAVAAAGVGGVLALGGDDPAPAPDATATGPATTGPRADALGPVTPEPLAAGLEGSTMDSDCFGPGERPSVPASFEAVGEVRVEVDFVQCGDADDAAVAARTMRFDLADLADLADPDGLPAGSRVVGVAGLFAVERRSSERHPRAVVTWSVRVGGDEICAPRVSGDPWSVEERCVTASPDGVAADAADLTIVQDVAGATEPGGMFAGVVRPRVLVRVPGGS